MLDTEIPTPGNPGNPPHQQEDINKISERTTPPRGSNHYLQSSGFLVPLMIIIRAAYFKLVFSGRQIGVRSGVVLGIGNPFLIDPFQYIRISVSCRVFITKCHKTNRETIIFIRQGYLVSHINRFSQLKQFLHFLFIIQIRQTDISHVYRRNVGIIDKTLRLENIKTINSAKIQFAFGGS